MILCGLTGSIGMGKSTTAAMFADRGVPVFDADAAVHALYAPGKKGTRAIAQIAPDAVDAAGGVDRDALARAVRAHPDLLAKVEAVIHPLVRHEREEFTRHWRVRGAPFVLYDIPLLFETGAEAWLDYIIVVTAALPIQKDRVLARPGMTVERFEYIVSRQVSDSEKRRRADIVIHTDRGLDWARSEVDMVISHLQRRARYDIRARPCAR